MLLSEFVKRYRVDKDRVIQIIEELKAENDRYSKLFYKRGREYDIDEKGVIILKIRLNKYH